MKITFLGTGTSQGVPVIGCSCQVCKSEDKKDRRLRCSILISVNEYNILIDTGPDFRQQMLINGITHLNAILLTHEHNDHVIGIDDIRPFNFRQRHNMPVYGLTRVLDDVRKKFAYIFKDNPYPGAPKVEFHRIEAGQKFLLFDSIMVKALDILHGNLPILGYRIGDFAYITDASFISGKTMEDLANLDVLVLNALQFRKHYSHFTFEEAIDMAQKIGAKTTYFTHMSHEMGKHEDILSKCPDGIEPAFDGLEIFVPS
ncbi:MAG: MBL fold metallo-hydrolase [Saprospiraceae bacterium]|nr:MBL fold metallo-hydrolase [Saprospiraceae bacterium]